MTLGELGHLILPVITRVIGITDNYRGITEAARGFTGNPAPIALGAWSR